MNTVFGNRKMTGRNVVFVAICLLIALGSCDRREKVPLKDLKIVMLGDSETRRINHYWGPDTNWNTLTGYNHIFNFGFDGYTSHDLLHLKSDSLAPVHLALNQKPDVLFLLIGINDIGQSVPFFKTVANIRAIIDTIQAHEVELVIQSVLPTTNYYDTLYGGFTENGVMAKQANRLNDKLMQICRVRDIPFLDLRPGMLVSGTYLRNDLTMDGIHLNYAGYQIWRDHLSDFFERYYE